MIDQQASSAPAASVPAAASAPLRLGVLSNRLSTRNRTRMAELRRVLSRHPAIPHVEIDDWSGMPDALTELMRRDLDAIAVNGGDGTVIGVLTEMRRRAIARMPAVIVLSSGNTNMIAGDVGPAGQPHRALGRILDAASSNARFLRKERRMIRVEPQGEPVQYGFFVGAIAIVRAIQLARRVLHPLGVNHGIGNAAALGLGASQVLFGGADGLLSGIPAEIGFDEEPMRRDDYAALMVTTLERMIFGALPFWGEEPEPMRSTLVRAPVDRPLRSLLPLLRGRPSARMLRHGYESRNAHRIRIAFNGPLAIDGEIIQARSERPIILSDGGIAEFLDCGA